MDDSSKIFSSLSDYIKFDYCLLMLTQANNVMFLFHVWPFPMKLTPARNEDGLSMKFKMKLLLSFMATLAITVSLISTEKSPWKSEVTRQSELGNYSKAAVALDSQLCATVGK